MGSTKIRADSTGSGFETLVARPGDIVRGVQARSRRRTSGSESPSGRGGTDRAGDRVRVAGRRRDPDHHGGLRDRGRPSGSWACSARCGGSASSLPNMITMMGLAVGIDYSLFIVSRYREERQRGREKLDAVGACRRHGEPGRVLQRDDGRPRARRHADRPHDDLPDPRGRGDHRGARLRRGVDDALARGDRAAGRQAQRRRFCGRKRADLEHGRPGGFWDGCRGASCIAPSWVWSEHLPCSSSWRCPTSSSSSSRTMRGGASSRDSPGSAPCPTTPDEAGVRRARRALPRQRHRHDPRSW